jgi:hypothetical protein
MDQEVRSNIDEADIELMRVSQVHGDRVASGPCAKVVQSFRALAQADDTPAKGA